MDKHTLKKKKLICKKILIGQYSIANFPAASVLYTKIRAEMETKKRYMKKKKKKIGIYNDLQTFCGARETSRCGLSPWELCLRIFSISRIFFYSWKKKSFFSLYENFGIYLLLSFYFSVYNSISFFRRCSCRVSDKNRGFYMCFWEMRKDELKFSAAVFSRLNRQSMNLSLFPLTRQNDSYII